MTSCDFLEVKRKATQTLMVKLSKLLKYKVTLFLPLDLIQLFFPLLHELVLQLVCEGSQKLLLVLSIVATKESE